MSTHPYDRLTPDVVLDALASVGLYGDGRLMGLSSYENRVYQAHLEDGRVVVAKFYRPGRWSDAQIDEEHAFARQLAEAEVPCVAPMRLPEAAEAAEAAEPVEGRTLHEQAGFRFAVCPRQGGRRPELDDPDVLERIGRFLARIHQVGEQQAFACRPPLNVQTLGEEPRAWLLASGLLPVEVREAWAEVTQAALRQAQAIWADGPAPQLLRLHGDCHPGNILWTEDGPQHSGGPHFVDLDDARTGPAVQDLWMLLSGEGVEQSRQRAALLDGYTQMRDFDTRELRLIEPLRTLRLLHYSAWLAQRIDDPAFRQTFDWFGTVAYWQGQVRLMHEQMEAMEQGV